MSSKISQFIGSIIDKRKERSERVKSLSEQLRTERMVHDRLKSANERELERFIEEERQERIKKDLECYRKKRQGEGWKTTAFNNNKKLLKDKSILKNGKIFNHKSSILNEKKIFLKH